MNNEALPAAVLRSVCQVAAFRIAPADSNYFALLFEPKEDRIEPVMVVEIFEVGGRTPPNRHVVAHEFFYVLSGEGVALADGVSLPARRGDALMLRPGVEHVIENVGPGKLYTLTFMQPNEGFAELICAGAPVELDAEDQRILGGVASAPRKDRPGE
jgi:mannose-6-phosphate isomerase-like protein (cupin superfamily)